MTQTDIHALLFDLDNVLVFSEVFHAKAWYKTIAHWGFSAEDLPYQEMVGRSDPIQAKEIGEKVSLNTSVDELCRMKTDHFLALAELGFEAPVGRDAFLKKMSASYKIGLVSSSFKKVVQHIIKYEGIADHFAFTIGYEDCQKHKPNPEPYLKALDKFGLMPHQALVIEDSPSGIQAALNAQIPVVGILKDQTPEQKVKGVAYFSSFTELDAWFEHKFQHACCKNT